MRTLLWFGLLAIVCVAACKKDNPNTCDPDFSACDALAIDAPMVACSTVGPDPECPDSRPVCDGMRCVGCAGDSDCDGRSGEACFGEPDTGACVACDEVDTESPECTTAGMNICDGARHTCRACVADSECASGLCDELSGACADEVLHVNNGVVALDTNPCTEAMPCLTLAGALAKSNTGVRYIAMHASAVDYNALGPTVIEGDDDVYIVEVPDSANPSRVAKLDRNGNGPILLVDGTGSNLWVIGVTLSGATGSSNGHGVACVNGATLSVLRVTAEGNTSHGIDSRDCTLLVDGSTIRNNVGGVSVDNGTMTIVNNFIVNNTGNPFGGLELANTDAGDIVAHNTIVRNQANNGMPGGIKCAGSGTLRNNIVYGSTVTSVEVSGCAHEHSLIGTTTVEPGTGNIVTPAIEDIRFVSTAVPGDYHLGAGSVALAKGGPADGTGRLALDVDGQPRPTTMADLGADELP